MNYRTMSDEGEVLFYKDDLCNHLNDLGYGDFGTYESNEQYQLDREVLCKDISRSLQSKTLKKYVSEPTPIDSYSHDMIMRLLRSKLLFFEDVKFVESVLSFCYVCDGKKINYVIGAVATSFLSIAAIFTRGIDSYLPLSCVAMSSIYTAWKLYKDKKEFMRNKLVTLFVKSLQNVCIDLHKVLRFLKEVEILSTGQVSTQNVGSAMYIPVNCVNGLNELPPWKTLPDLRKSVADSLIDMINIFSCGCDYVSKFSLSSMDIKCFNSNIQVSLDQMKVGFEYIKTFDGCISIKDLQVLNDNYLLAQSEFLKSVAFYLCPAVWKGSKDEFSIFKNEVLMKYLENTQTKICDISLRLKLSFDLQNVLSCSEINDRPTLQQPNPDNDKSPRADLEELQALQVELHQIFLLVLSTVQKAKSLEDSLDTFCSKITEDKYIPIGDLKENISQQLSIVKNDLGKVVNDYDHIYCQILSKNKSVGLDHENRSFGTASTVVPYQPQNDNPEGIKVGHSDFSVSSPDEVFLALSGSKHDDFETNSDDWFIEKKPKIPHTLLTELSTTLKPIKKIFEERERLVLKKLGIQDTEVLDIDNKDAESPVGHQLLSSQCFSCKSGHDETQNEPSVQTDNSILMASLLRMNLQAKQRSNLEEECFSNA